MNVIKCFKCRSVLLNPPEVEQLTPHGEAKEVSDVDCSACESFLDDKVIYLKDDILPEWITSKIQDSSWMKGKLHCEHCNTKIGSFDFVSGRKCHCGETTLPPVYFTKSQVDRPLKRSTP